MKCFFKKKCNHDFEIKKYSNVLQLDYIGYPLRLCICKCTKCGEYDQRWIDVNKSSLKQLDDGTSVLLEWHEVKNAVEQMTKFQ